MKNALTPIICALISLLPALLSGQAHQDQNQNLVKATSLRALQSESRQAMSVNPILRVSNIGSSGQDGVSIELNDLTLTNPGPSLLLDFPSPGSTSGSDIKLRPGSNKPYLIIRNIGSSGQDGVGLRINNFCCLDSFFDVFYNLKTHTETHRHGVIGDPDFDLLRITSYDRATPKLSDKITSSNPGMADRFFDVFYDLALGKRGVGFGFEPNDICCITTFDKATPKLQEHIVSGSPLALGFFDVFYDLNKGIETHAHGDPDFDLLRSTLYNKNSRRLKDSIYSHNAMANSFFDIEYDLPTGSITQTHGDPNFDLLRVTTFNKTIPMLQDKIYSRLLEHEGIFYTMHDLHNAAYTVQYRESDFDFASRYTFDVSIPKLTETISCTNPMGHGFFDISYDLGLARETHAFRILPGDPDFDLIVVRNWDKATPKLQETISSSNPALLNSFFDITYDLGAQFYKVKFNDLLVTSYFTPSTPKFEQKISSSLLPYIDSFFDITYDLAAKSSKVKFEDVFITKTFDSATPKLQERYATSLLPYLESFFDITYDFGAKMAKIQLEDLLVTRLFDPGASKIRDRYSTTDPLLANSFFDITYDLPAHFYKVQFEDLLVTSYFTSPTPKYEQKISSSLLPYIDSFFDITYDISDTHLQKHSMKAFAEGGMMPLETRYEYDALSRKIREVRTDNQSTKSFITTYDFPNGKQKMENNNTAFTITSSEPATICWRFASMVPAVQGFMDVCHDVSVSNIQTMSTQAGMTAGLLPLEQRIEYDAPSRRIREVCTDLQTPSASLTLERRLSPTGSSLFVSNKLEVQGAVEVVGSLSTPGAGPLMVADNLQVNGSLHQITGNLTLSGASHQINGNVQVMGNFSVIGAKTFKIDHPLDPDNKYLYHSCVESPDMMNVYNGNATTDKKGYATILLPDYFEALNVDYRYQLTCIGKFAQAIVAEKIQNNKFVIRTDKPNVEVSWQVTGIRNDPASKQSGFAVEVEKEPGMRGTRLYNR